MGTAKKCCQGGQEHSLTKRAKFDFLQLTPAEWTWVGQFADLLSYADIAQQAFSSDQGSTLHLAIPTLETLHKSWSSRAERPKYARFAAALRTAAGKLDEYYEKTTDSPAYIIAMCFVRGSREPSGRELKECISVAYSCTGLLTNLKECIYCSQY